MTQQNGHNLHARQPKDSAVLCFYTFTFSGESALRGMLARLSEDERATVRHLAAAFYRALVDEEAG